MRCKVYCNLKQPESGNQGGFYLSFSAVVDGSTENKEFFKYTPGGQITFYVLNSVASSRFEVGKMYYVDFTPAN